MKRASIGLVAALLVLVALPALGKGVVGVEISGPGIADPLVIEADGTSGSAHQVNAWIEATGMGYLIYGANGGNLTDRPPTKELGPEYQLTWLHMVPGDVAEILGSLYPFAEGGALVYIEPGYPIEELNMTVPGGWFVSDADVIALLEEYGVDVASINLDAAILPESAPPAGTSWMVPIVPAALAVLVGLWAIRRRPVTSEDVAPQPST
jgi:MYXO-CTERM domain-containing protein